MMKSFLFSILFLASCLQEDDPSVHVTDQGDIVHTVATSQLILPPGYCAGPDGGPLIPCPPEDGGGGIGGGIGGGDGGGAATCSTGAIVCAPGGCEQVTCGGSSTRQTGYYLMNCAQTTLCSDGTATTSTWTQRTPNASCSATTCS